jgi:hypothetical protein
VRWNLNATLICISFLAKDVEHFFIYLWAICTSILHLYFISTEVSVQFICLFISGLLIL